MSERALGKMIVGNLIATAALRFPDREAFYCSSTKRRFSFSQINERCNRLANGLSDMGLHKGDVVAFLCSNRAEIVEIFFALAKSGLIGIPLNYRLAPVEMMIALSLAIWRIRSRTSCCWLGSRPSVGSSITNTAGS